MRSASGFVGRKPELDRLLSAAGRAETALVVGEAGVGKTRLVQELGRLLSGSGCRLWTARCLPLTRRLPLLPVVAILREQFADSSGAAFDVALDRCPMYVREELASVLPELGSAWGPPSEDGWRQQRLFAAVVGVWGELVARQPAVIVIEDLQWSDPTTRDFVTYATAHLQSVPLVLTSRTDEPEHDDAVRGWLHQAVRMPELERVVLGPLTRDEVGDLVTELAGRILPVALVDELFRRSEGIPFFLEQLVTSGSYGPGALPGELSRLLEARADTLAPLARRTLDLLAVAARPLTQPEIAVGVVQPTEDVRWAVRDLVAAQLVKRNGEGFAGRPLLAEAVAGALLAGDRAELHARVAEVLARRGDPRLAAETAQHWAGAGRVVAERRARRTAARDAETNGAHAEAAGQWERAFDLGEVDDPAAAQDALRAVAAWEAAGEALRGEAVGERGARVAARRGHLAEEAALRVRLAVLHHLSQRKRGLRELSAAVDIYERLEPTSEQVAALHLLFEMHRADGDTDIGRPYLDRAVDLCRQASLPADTRVRPLTTLALEQLEAGEIDAGLVTLKRARGEVGAELSPSAQGWLAVAEAYAFRMMNRLEESATAAQQGLASLRAVGLDHAFVADLLTANLLDAWLERGRVDAAGACIDALSDRAVRDGRDVLCSLAVRVDTLRGRLEHADSWRQRVLRLPFKPGLEMETEFGRIQAELALWQGRAILAVDLVEPIIDRLLTARQERLSAPLFVLGMRACADLAESAAARRCDDELAAARTRARDLQDRHLRACGDPFAPQPFHVLAVAEGCEWVAEAGRALRPVGTDEQSRQWADVAGQWQKLQRPHRAAYARWRQTEALLRMGDRPGATLSLQTGWLLADQHVPLRAQLAVQARLARMEVTPTTATKPARPGPSVPPAPYGLTSRELEVLLLLGEGLTNAQIGARLYMSSKTASVHVSAILRKLGATNRVHAAAIAERAGLLQMHTGPASAT